MALSAVIVKLLLDAHADVHAKNVKECTPFQEARASEVKSLLRSAEHPKADIRRFASLSEVVAYDTIHHFSWVPDLIATGAPEHMFYLNGVFEFVCSRACFVAP